MNDVFFPIQDIVGALPSPFVTPDRYYVSQDDGLLVGEIPPDQNIYEGNPHVMMIGSDDNMKWASEHADWFWQANLGTLILFNDRYKNAFYPTGTGASGKPMYEFKNMDDMKWVENMKAHGFLVLAYYYLPSDEDNRREKIWGDKTAYEHVLDMIYFASAHGLDGYYLDGGHLGTIRATANSLRILRTFREVINSLRILRAFGLHLFIHNTTALIGGNWKTNPYGIIPDIFINQYANLGSLGLEGLDPEWWPEDAKGWNKFKQSRRPALPFAKYSYELVNGEPPMSREEFYRAAAANGVLTRFYRNYQSDWLKYLEIYKSKREEANK